MWIACFVLSLASVAAAAVFPLIINRNRGEKRFNPFNTLFAGVFLAGFFLFLPIHWASAETTALGNWRDVLLSVFNAMQIFTIGTEFSLVSGGMSHCPDWLDAAYQVWAAAIFVIAPVLTFGFVLSLFKNLSANLKYLRRFFSDVFVFTELNDRSIVLAEDLKRKHPKAAIVFTDVFDTDEASYELAQRAKDMGAICFKKDIMAVDISRHSKKKEITFFAIGGDETENLNHGLKLIETFKNRDNTHLFVFSTKVESELLLTAIDKGKIKVRRINEVQSLLNRVLYENGSMLFDSALEGENGIRDICAVVVGMGRHGTEMVKDLAWFGQMDGYRIHIHAFDKDPLALERFTAMAPELMSERYNGVYVEGEAQYHITVHPKMDVDTAAFARKISELKRATYVLVALGDDDINIKTAVNLRMLFARTGARPVIQAIVYNTQQKQALTDIKNYRGQAYNIEFIGDLESSYVEDVIIDSDLEADALRRHLKWGKEEEFWTYEYNYRSSVASAIHMAARIKCGIPGAAKKEAELTKEERDTIECLEHRRWNAYMRAEGYIYSGSKEKSSRNDLAKMHHDLVEFAELTEEEKRKDSAVGTN